MTSLTLRPNAAGDSTGFSTQYPDTGEHYDKVDDVSPDGDTTYVYQGADPVDVYIAIKENGTITTYSISPTSSYAEYSKEWTVRPSDSNSWTTSDIDNLQIGVKEATNNVIDLYNIDDGNLSGVTINSVTVYINCKVVSQKIGNRVYVTQMYAIVDYTSAAATFMKPEKRW